MFVLLLSPIFFSFFFFFNDTATTEIYTLSLHDALPICIPSAGVWIGFVGPGNWIPGPAHFARARDRKSTRLNSSHLGISYAVFCLKKKKKKTKKKQKIIHKSSKINNKCIAY